MIKIRKIREKDDTIRERLKSLPKTENGCMNPFSAINELANHLLGEDWYIVDPVTNQEAVEIITYEIERKYKRVINKDLITINRLR